MSSSIFLLLLLKLHQYLVLLVYLVLFKLLVSEGFEVVGLIIIFD